MLRKNNAYKSKQKNAFTATIGQYTKSNDDDPQNDDDSSSESIPKSLNSPSGSHSSSVNQRIKFKASFEDRVKLFSIDFPVTHKKLRSQIRF